MLNKYTFSNNLAVVDLPSIWKIGNGKVSITHASGTNTVNIPSSGYLTVKVGNIFSIQEEDISPIEAIEVENPNSENNNGNNSGSDSGGSGSITGNISSDIQEVHGSNKGTVPISLILNNTSNEDIYITGYLYCYIYKAEIDDKAPISYIIDPYSKNSAKYYVPAKTRVVIPPEKLSIQVDGDNLPSNEIPSRYYGGVVWYFNDEPVNWRAFSWTKNSAGTLAHDSAVVDTVPGTVNFVSGGSVEYILRGTNEAKEGTIIKYKNAINLETWEANPDPLPDQTPDPLPTPLYVDLGLPSGTLWATGNIIKSNENYSIGNPTDKGCYFSWANIDGYNDTEYIFSQNNYNQTSGGLYEISQNENIQRSSIYDAATAKLGSNYMLPTVEQAQELTSYCSKSVETINEIDVLKFTSTINGNYIYIPFAGYYDADNSKTPDITHNDCRFWTSIAYTEANPNYARYYIAYKSQTEGFCSDAHRYEGFPIRAIFVNN